MIFIDLNFLSEINVRIKHLSIDARRIMVGRKIIKNHELIRRI